MERRGPALRALRPRSSSLTRLFVRLLLALILAFCGWVLVWSVLLASHARDLTAGGEDALRHVRERNLGAIERSLPRLQRALTAVRRDLRALRPVTWMPGIRSERATLERVIDNSLFLVEAGEVSFSLAAEVQGAMGTMSSRTTVGNALPRVRDILRRQRTTLTTLASRGAELDKLPTSRSRSGRLRSLDAQTTTLRRLATAAADVLSRGDVLFRLAGVDGERRYLLLFQNADELRPGGGLISMYGLVTVRDGKVTDLLIRHVNEIYTKSPAEPRPVPEPLARYVLPTENLPNVNWAPEPAAWLNRATEIWTDIDGRSIDGVIVVATPLLRDFIRLYGPLRFPELPEPLTPDNVLVVIDRFTIAQYEQSFGTPASYDIVGNLVRTIVRRLEESAPLDLVNVLEIIKRRAAARDFYIFPRAPSAQRDLERLGLSYRIPVPLGDEVFILDSNLGSAKADASLLRQLEHTVDLRSVRSPRARTELHYDYTRAKPDERTWPYQGYVRFLAPAGATLRLDGSDGTLAKPTGSEAARAAFGAYVSIPFGGTDTATLVYTLPETVVQEVSDGRYTLTLRKQGGLELPYTISVLLPPGWSSPFVSASLGTVTVATSGQPRVSWTGILTEDVTLTVTRGAR